MHFQFHYIFLKYPVIFFLPMCVCNIYNTVRNVEKCISDTILTTIYIVKITEKRDKCHKNIICITHDLKKKIQITKFPKI